MFVRAKTRRKDGKEHRFWSIVENCRASHGRVFRRQVLFLGEITEVLPGRQRVMVFQSFHDRI
jgi:hypothetical protein